MSNGTSTITIPLTRELFRSLNTYLFEAGQVINPSITSMEFFKIQYSTPVGEIRATCYWDEVERAIVVNVDKKPFLVSLETVRIRVSQVVAEWAAKHNAETEGDVTTPPPPAPPTPPAAA